MNMGIHGGVAMTWQARVAKCFAFRGLILIEASAHRHSQASAGIRRHSTVCAALLQHQGSEFKGS